MSFFTYSQNNSGGGFDIDENVAPFVIIEADSAEKADTFAETIGIYFNGCDDGTDCPCCGDRWYPASSWNDTETPQIYGQSPEEYTGNTGNIIWSGKGNQKEVVVYYKDGRKEWY